MLKEEFHLDAVGGDDRVVIRLKWLASDRLHSVEAHRTGLASHLSALGLDPLPVAPLVAKAAHVRMVVAQAKRTKKIWARNDDFAVRLRDAYQLGEERLRFFDVLKDV